MQGLRNELANARNHVTILNISLDNERIEAFRAQQEAEDALNNEKNACRRRMEMMDRALNDERTVRQQQQAEIVNAQRERDDARRNAHHWTMRYNNDINQLQIERNGIRHQL